MKAWKKEKKNHDRKKEKQHRKMNKLQDKQKNLQFSERNNINNYYQLWIDKLSYSILLVKITLLLLHS